jgi:hypothetical protein
MRKKPSYTSLLRPTRLLISEKSATYTIKWSYTIIWQVRVGEVENKILTGDAAKWSRAQLSSTFFVEIMSEEQTAAEFFKKIERIPKQSAFFYWESGQIL